MNLFTRNNYLLIEVQEEKQEAQSGILVPDDYKTTESLFKVVKLINAPKLLQYYDDIGHNMVVTSHLIQEFMVCGEKYTIVPASAVVGIFKERD